jgi:hypothetical protein
MKTIDYDTEPRQQPRPVNVPGACQSIRRVLSRSGGMAFEAHDLTASGSAGSGAALVWFSTDSFHSAPIDSLLTVERPAGGGERRHSHEASTQRIEEAQDLGRSDCTAARLAAAGWRGARWSLLACQFGRTRRVSASTAAATAAGLLTGVR